MRYNDTDHHYASYNILNASAGILEVPELELPGPRRTGREVLILVEGW